MIKQIKEKLQNKFLDYISKKFPTQISERAYKAAELNRYAASWFGSYQSLSQDIKAGKERLLYRAREASQNDPLAIKFISLLGKNIVGADGFTLRVKAYDLAKENNKTVKKLDTYANTIIQDEFTKWGKRSCNIKGNVSFRQYCKQIIETGLGRDGEIFILLIYTNENKWGLTTQIIESEYCPHDYDAELPNGNYIFMGIEYDTTSKPVAYYFRKKIKYGDKNIRSTDYVRYPAERVIHLFNSPFTDANRGIPPLASALIKMYHLNSYQEAILIKARSVAQTTLVLTKKDSSNTGAINNIAGVKKETPSDPLSNLQRTIEPGEVWINPDGYESKDFDPKAPTGQEGPFTNLLMRIIASALDVSYITLGNDYSNVNYTSSRTALLDERDTYTDMQNWFIEQFLEPLFEKWLEIALLKNALGGLPLSKFDKFNNVWFYGRRWKWVNPVDEVNANILANQNNLRTLEDILSEQGYDLDEQLEQLAMEKKKKEELGLMIVENKKEKVV